MSTIEVAWQRSLLEPPEPGRCEDPQCVTVSLGLVEPLLVATYREAGRTYPVTVCAACDERRLRAAIAEDEDDGR
jgi:hypothetical protein